jgi:hypothetical protein
MELLCNGFSVLYFLTVMYNRRGKGVLMEWRVATLPMSWYIVRKINTRSVPHTYAGYRRSVALWIYVSTEIPTWTCSGLKYLRVGTTNHVLRMKVLICGFGELHFVGWRLSWFLSTNKVDITTKIDLVWISRMHNKWMNEWKANVLCFGKSLKGVQFSCSRLTLEE